MKRLRDDEEDGLSISNLKKNKIAILTTDLSLSLFLGKHSMASASDPYMDPFQQA